MITSEHILSSVNRSAYSKINLKIMKELSENTEKVFLYEHLFCVRITLLAQGAENRIVKTFEACEKRRGTSPDQS